MTAAIPHPYPLAWPPDRARTPAHRRERDRYEVDSMARAMAGLETEVRRWRTTSARILNWELTSNLSGRTRGNPEDPGVALWFDLATGDATLGQDLCVMACDRYAKVWQNVRAIGLTLERLRLVDEVGSYSLVAAVAGAKALPPPRAAGPDRPWHDVLQVKPDAPLAVAEATYRALAKAAGEGSPRLLELNVAITEAREVLE